MAYGRRLNLPFLQADWYPTLMSVEIAKAAAPGPSLRRDEERALLLEPREATLHGKEGLKARCADGLCALG